MIYIGYDSSNLGQQLAYDVCFKSIKYKNNKIKVFSLNRQKLIEENIFTRQNNDGATQFTYTRFLVPYLQNYTGWALFCDSDFLWLCDPQEIFDTYFDNKYAVYCVKHQIEFFKDSYKMNNQKQSWYPKKNWSSLMLFNCSHPSIKNLNLETVNNQSGSWLHRFEWCLDSEVGEISFKYNYLVGYYKDNTYKAIHYTDGGPWHPGYEQGELSELWLNILDQDDKKKLSLALKEAYASNILCCIPARYQSSRLPGKPLLTINDKTIINLVYQQVKKSMIQDIIVLTDDQRIFDEVIKFGGQCAMVTSECLNGTERIVNYLQTIDHLKYDKILNVQGDEPFIQPEAIDALIKDNYFKQVECSTICYHTKEEKEILSKSKGKAILDQNNNIIYCSRNVIPSCKNSNIVKDIDYTIHVGIFLFDKNYLLNHYNLQNTPYQLIEDIEWLKIIESGFKINSIIWEKMETGVDTIEDYNYLRGKYDNHINNSLNKINTDNLLNDPYPHIVIEDFLDNDLFQKLKDNFPTQGLKPNYHRDSLCEENYTRFVTILNNIEDCKNFDSSYKELYQLFSSCEYLNKISQVFQTEIPESRTEMQLIKDISNYKITPHCDTYIKRHKYLTSLFYIPDDNTSEDIGTELYIPQEDGEISGIGGSYDIDDPINYPKKFKLVKKVKYKPNTLLIFIPEHGVSWHGVSQIKSENCLRKTIQVFQKVKE